MFTPLRLCRYAVFVLETFQKSASYCSTEKRSVSLCENVQFFIWSNNGGLHVKIKYFKY